MTDVEVRATGADSQADLNRRTVAELRALATSLGISGASQLRKGELVDAINENNEAGVTGIDTPQADAGVAETTTPRKRAPRRATSASAAAAAAAAAEAAPVEQAAPAEQAAPVEQAAPAEKAQRPSRSRKPAVEPAAEAEAPAPSSDVADSEAPAE